MNLNSKTLIYLGLTCFLGAELAVLAWGNWSWEDPLRFVFYLGFAAITSRLKVRLPGIIGNLSVNFVFCLLAIVELPLSQALMVSLAGSLAQTLVAAANRPRPVQVAFNASVLLTATMVAYNVFHSSELASYGAGMPMLLFIATVAYYLTNTMLVAAVIAFTEGTRLFQTWYDNLFWTVPQFLFGATLTAIITTVNQSLGWQFSFLILPGLYLVYSSYNLYLGRLEAEKKHVTETAALHLRTIEALALAIEAKDDTTHAHLRRVKVYATEIAKELGLGDEQIRAVEAASLLHDIGKLAVPEYIINKPGKLTREEFDRMKVHPIVGAEILECVNFPYPVVPIVRSHHEKWDGSGYPDGLKGEDIPVGARIISVVDCLDALASDRQYRRALPLEEALAKVCDDAGKAFDPAIVAILERRCDELEQMAHISAEASPAKLSVKVRVERGEGPAAGFESTDQANTQPQPAAAGGDFIRAIASARQEFQMLHETIGDLGSSLSLEETLSLLANRIRQLIPYEAIAIYTMADAVLRPAFVQGKDSELFSALRIPLGEGISGWVAQNHRPMVNGNPSVECGYLNDPRKFSTLRSALAVPLESAGTIIGVMTLYREPADAFTHDHQRILQTVSAKASVTIENTLKHTRVEKDAGTDQLTGLANAHSLTLHLAAEVARLDESGGGLAVLVLDLDGFKAVNDSFGHLTGNRVLELVASGLRDHCRSGDFVARMGGDEFVLVIPGLTSRGLDEKRQQLHTMVSEVGQRVCGARTGLAVSLGEAYYPTDGEDVETLLSIADQRMYKVKRQHHQETGFTQTVETGVALTIQ